MRSLINNDAPRGERICAGEGMVSRDHKGDDFDVKCMGKGKRLVMQSWGLGERPGLELD